MTEEWSSSNQAKAEPIPPTPAHGDMPSATSPGPRESTGGESSRVPGVQGSSPDAFETDTDEGAERVQASLARPDVAEESGDVQEVPVPSETAAEGTSESMEPVDGVRVTAIAPEGLADGETDNRMPPTTTF